jgi:hypothetical protein
MGKEMFQRHLNCVVGIQADFFPLKHPNFFLGLNSIKKKKKKKKKAFDQSSF